MQFAHYAVSGVNGSILSHCFFVDRHAEFPDRENVHGFIFLLHGEFWVVTAYYILEKIIEVIIFLLIKSRKCAVIEHASFFSFNLFRSEDDVEWSTLINL